VTRAQIGQFTSDTARTKFLRMYDDAMRLWPEPRTAHDVETRFGTVHVHRYGPATGEPIVLLHGHGANASTWYPQIAALGAHHPVYAVDTIDDPGRSVQRVPTVSHADNAAWIDDVLTGLDLDRVHLVGMSYGGWLALNQGAHGAGRLATITALDPGGLQKVRPLFLVTMVAGLPAMAAPKRLRPALARLLANHALVMRPEVMAPVMVGTRHFRPHRPPAPPLPDEALRAIRVPALVLLGGRSTLLHADRALARVSDLIPDVRAEIIPRVGHSLSLEAPDLINARILRFVTSMISEDRGRSDHYNPR
jgi:pimeloyl-ACP methyl ester carboxylesterase